MQVGRAVGGGIGSGGFFQSNFGNGTNINEPKSLKEALGKKGKSKTIGDAVMGANPYYDPTYTYAEFTENCNRCVVAYEARRRGYDVVAQPTYQGDTFGQRVIAPNGTINARWQGSFQGAKTQMIKGNTTADIVKNIDNTMKEYGNGSRGIIGVTWKAGGGHVFNVERANGKTYYVDAQVGKRYTPMQIMSEVVPGSVRLVRTDNLKFSDRAKNALEPAGARR